VNPSASRAWHRWLPPATVGLLAFAIRALHAPSVFLDGRVQLRDPDAYYHMRRILFTLVNFPTTLGIDPYLAPPAGGRSIWPPLFDTTAAWLLWPFWASGGELSVERAAAWLPPLLGALTAVAVVLVGRRLFDATVGTLAGLIVALLPTHAHYSQVGFVDHHAAVALAAILLIAAALWLLRALLDPDPGLRRLVAPVVACGAGLGGILLLWPGGLIHVAAVVTCLLLSAATRNERGEAVRSALAVSGAAAIACLLLAPAGPSASGSQWSDWTPVVLSRFQPWLYAAIALQALACGWIWRATGVGGDVAGRLLSSIALGLAVLGGSALLLPGLSDGIADAQRWLTKGEVFQAMVAESQPLLSAEGTLSAARLRALFGDAAYVFPLLLAWLAWASRRRDDRDAIALLLIWAVALSAAALVQRRFSNSAALPFALVTAWAAVQAGRIVAVRFAPGAARRGAAALVTALLVGAGLAAIGPAHGAGLADAARALRGAGTSPGGTGRIGQMVALGEWLRANTPPTAGFFAADARPEYSVLAMWGHGHVIRYVGRRPPVVDNFGDDVSPENFAASIRYFGSHREEEGLAILDRLGARYVVVDPVNVFLFAQSGARSLSHRLYRFDGSGLSQHRLVHEMEGDATGAPPGTIPYKIFERVPGARLRGLAAPGETVTAALDFTTNRGRQGTLTWTADAGPDGSWELVVPYATASRGDIVTGERYWLDLSTGPQAVGVSEAAVRRGSILALPAPG